MARWKQKLEFSVKISSVIRVYRLLLFFSCWTGCVRREDYTAKHCWAMPCIYLFYFCSEEISECEMGMVVAGGHRVGLNKDEGSDIMHSDLYLYIHICSLTENMLGWAYSVIIQCNTPLWRRVGFFFCFRRVFERWCVCYHNLPFLHYHHRTAKHTFSLHPHTHYTPPS